ncbi:hypothetical protein I5M32_11195 [Pedobacter sp. SD-b]|uniref:Uncharacterized protein n=1 Tax=Pedobacter segetis TaxID=2793069 RepID=A0ABS1BKW4_9SPHI|nr:hypothetical protein [Pedobacter segetis]MBK0383522.1 hypothetical protein [Pedobacter segetis]
MKTLKFIPYIAIPLLLFFTGKNLLKIREQNQIITGLQSEKYANQKAVLKEATIINKKINKEGIQTVTIKALSNILPVAEVLKNATFDSIAKANNIKPKQVIGYSSVNFVSKADFLQVKKERDSLKRQVLTYKNKWISIVYTPKKDTADTSGGFFNYKYTGELNGLQYWERYKILGLKLGRKSAYINTALIDSNATINSIRTFDIPYQKRKFSVSVQLRSIYNYNQQKFLFGPGLSFDFKENLNLLAYSYYNPAFSRWEYVFGINKNLITF